MLLIIYFIIGLFLSLTYFNNWANDWANDWEPKEERLLVSFIIGVIWPIVLFFTFIHKMAEIYDGLKTHNKQ